MQPGVPAVSFHCARQLVDPGGVVLLQELAIKRVCALDAWMRGAAGLRKCLFVGHVAVAAPLQVPLTEEDFKHKAKVFFPMAGRCVRNAWGCVCSCSPMCMNC